jgi:hypothetical protein
MGQAKNEMMRKEDLRGQAQRIALEADAVEECPHGTLLSTDDAEAENRAYAIATNEFKAGKVDGARKELMDAIKQVLDEGAGECYSCSKNARD